MYNLNYAPTLGVQSRREIISGGTRTKKVECHCFKGLMNYGNGEREISIYVTSWRFINLSTDIPALSSHFLDQACVRNLLKNASHIIRCLKCDTVGFTGVHLNRDFVAVFYFRWTTFTSETTTWPLYQNQEWWNDTSFTQLWAVHIHYFHVFLRHSHVWLIKE
jgi:hypothetical protein